MKMFEAFKTMHEEDCKNNTITIGVCDHLISANTVKGGGQVSVGVPHNEVIKIMSGERLVVLLLIDKKEYSELTSNQFKNN
jgi:hypothetical protein